MKIELLHQPGSATAKVHLAAGETCVSEGGAMIAMSSNMGIVTTTHKKSKGSILKSLKRMLAGESFFLNHFTPEASAGELYLSSSLPGDMMVQTLQAGESLIVQGGSFVASEDQVEVDLGWEGFKSFFSGESIFWLNLKGPGQVLLNSFGAIYPVEVDGETIVDTGHIVAFNETLSFEITKAGSSWLSSFLGGEGFVCKFKGKGTVWCQSHHPQSFGKLLGPLLKAR
jgi:uncharacterized protein (TIGR00266 family)